MADILILGAGVMGSALAITAASHDTNTVRLVGSPLDNAIVDSINHSRQHPTLSVAVPERVLALHEASLNEEITRQADIIVIGVSSPGVPWAVKTIKQYNANPACIALVTKGLVSNAQALPPATYATALQSELDSNVLLGIGGPCIARELALGIPTAVTFAATDIALAQQVKASFQNSYYRISTHPDFIGLEACAALKNFYCIGVSAMIGAWQLDGVSAKNPVAALFNQAVIEMGLLSNWIRGHEGSPTEAIAQYNPPAYDLPGMGDLHVTVGGGRNSRLGTLLGQGNRLSDIVNGPMQGVTVEGLDTGRQLLSGFRHAISNGTLPAAALPLTIGILDSIEYDKLFEFDFTHLPCH
jgi:glycerol-3-phosphate dehydrogenase (NAD(P)+)